MDYSSIKAHFKVREDHGNKCKAICPAHPDKEASLSITYNGSKGGTALFCHAGCETADILSAAGLKMSDLFDEPLKVNSEVKKDSHIEAVYKYTDKSGNLLFEKVRFRQKRFSQRRIVNGLTVWGLDAGIYYETFPGSKNFSVNKKEGAREMKFDAVEPVIYNLPAVMEGIKTNQLIFIVEGEKDVDNVNKLGLIACCNFDGASKSTQKPKWRESYNETFRGAKVVLIPDNDDPGRAHMENIAENIQDIAENIKIISLQELPPKGDVSDWLQLGHTKEELLDLVQNAETWERDLNHDEDLINFNFSDVGNAERLAALYHKKIRYNPVRCKWLIWSGKYWEVDSSGKIEDFARKTIRKLQCQGREITEDTEKNLKLKEQTSKFVLRSEADGKIKAMVNQAKTNRALLLKESDKDVYLFNLKNGTLDLRTGTLKNHDRNNFITKIVDVEYDPEAKCPNWINFIKKIFFDNTELINYIQKSIGYSMTGDANLQCFYILHGQGSNGKGTFMKTVMTILGEYASVLKSNSLMEKMGDEGARGDLAKLEGKRFVCINELEEGKSFDEALLKSLSSGADEAIPVRRLYEEEFDLHPTFKMWMTTNKLPKIKGTDNGIWRRVRKIPFDYNFDNDENKDVHFFDNALLPEMNGILNWAIEGCLKWQHEGMILPEIVKYANEDYKKDMDPVQRFLDECCMVSETCRAKRSALYDEYCEWCKENKEYTLSSIKLNKKLLEKGFEQIKSMGSFSWKGLGLVDNENDDPLTQGKDNVSPFWGQEKF